MDMGVVICAASLKSPMKLNLIIKVILHTSVTKSTVHRIIKKQSEVSCHNPWSSRQKNRVLF